MPATLVVISRLIALLCRGHRAVALEHLALRRQLAAPARTRKRPQIRITDRPVLGLPRARVAGLAHSPDHRAP
jgi:hypothetical protein